MADNQKNLSLWREEQDALLHAINVVLDREDVADEFDQDELTALGAVRDDLQET